MLQTPAFQARATILPHPVPAMRPCRSSKAELALSSPRWAPNLPQSLKGISIASCTILLAEMSHQHTMLCPVPCMRAIPIV